MATAKSYSALGKETGSVELPAALFDQQVNEHLLYQAVKTYLTNQRQGTAKVKSRVEVSGGGRKPWKQKGTGRARSGSNTSPIWVGGGRAHGPEPHDYHLDLPKKQRRLALASALSLKAREAKVSVLTDIKMDAPKSKTIATMLGAMGLGGTKTLVVFGAHEENVHKSCRNLRRLSTTLAHQVNTYGLLDCETVIFTESGLKRLTEVFAR
jgi:large subunit ribosomal protein L4